MADEHTQLAPAHLSPGRGLILEAIQNIPVETAEVHVTNTGAGFSANVPLGKGWSVGGFGEYVIENRDFIFGGQIKWQGGGRHHGRRI